VCLVLRGTVAGPLTVKWIERMREVGRWDGCLRSLGRDTRSSGADPAPDACGACFHEEFARQISLQSFEAHLSPE
jgi:hypothetical protein